MLLSYMCIFKGLTHSVISYYRFGFELCYNGLKILLLFLQNICPAHVPDIVVYIDAITVILEEASKEADRPLSVPIACVEAGTGQTLPNLALRLFLSFEAC